MAKTFSSIHIDANVEIGDFRIERRLGAGGMGVVYLARQKSLDRLVALKVLGAALVHPGQILRFKREAKAAARLHHPAIATVHCVEQDDLACYMAMEFIDGLTLRQIMTQLGSSHDPHLGIETALHAASGVESKPPWVRFSDLTVEETSDFDVNGDGKPESALEAITPEAEQLIQSRAYIRRVCEIVRDAALALEHAHSQGVIHRDVKPQNIMLDRQGRVHVIDFGVAHFFDGAMLTEPGQLVGTPMYMSPEQVVGRGVDHRSDIYSLGLVMYELLTLRPPLQAPTREAVLRGVVTKAMVPVNWKNNGVPRSVENVVHRAIAKDPDDRYPSAGELAEDLQRCLDNQPVDAEPYRYRFDEREIVADRPWQITAASFWFFYAASYYVLISSPRAVVGAYNRNEGWQGMVSASLPFLGAAAVCCFVGHMLLYGRPWSRWLGIPVAGLITGHSMHVFLKYATVYLFGKPIPDMLRMLTAITGWILPLLVMILGGLLVIAVLLMQRKPKAWFEFSKHIRAEHDALVTSTGTGK